MIEDPFKTFRLVENLNNRFKSELINSPARFRASLNSISLISLSLNTPQLGFKCSLNELSNTAIDIQQYLGKLKNIERPGRPTPEKLLQSWIILNDMLHGSLPFNTNIGFFTDEFAMPKGEGKKLVSDILGFNKKTNALVIIELKSDRKCVELTCQLDKREALIQANTNFYKGLLQTHSFEWTEPYIIEKIAVWPHSTSVIKKKFKKDIREICYTKKGYDFSFAEAI